ncbi:MAG TPA: nucleotidyltransferase domain-containing protein [Vineibacter sp.]|nr:nucleotidyltransferase domain-containing protein [Vineibacter sp.]
MDRQTIIDRVRSHENELRARGVARAALVGSAARAESRPDSDIDLVIELRNSARFSLISHASARSMLEEWLETPTDVLIWEDLEPDFRDRIARDRVEIF